MKMWLFVTSVFSACGWIVLAITFYWAFFSGSAVITLNKSGEMYREAFVFIPIMLAVSISNPILAFKLCKDGDC